MTRLQTCETYFKSCRTVDRFFFTPSARHRHVVPTIRVLSGIQKRRYSITMMVGILLTLILSTVLPFVQAGVFVDDLGVEHILGSEDVVCLRAFDAVALYHLGLPAERLGAVFGNWVDRGSTLDLENPQPALSNDLNAEEVDFLKSAVDLSPECSDKDICHDFDVNLLNTAGITEVILHGNDFSFDIYETIRISTGKVPIFIDNTFRGDPGCRDTTNLTVVDESKCHGRSSIDYVHVFERLAKALEVELPESLDDDKQALCEASQRFAESSKTAHAKGIRVMAASFIPASPFTIYFLEYLNEHLRTLEQLGMPIVYAGACPDTPEECGHDIAGFERMTASFYFKSCENGVIDTSCNLDNYYPVDFWMTVGATLSFLKNMGPIQIENLFPDEALIAGQYGHMWYGNGAMSYKQIAISLNHLAEQLDNSDRIYPRTNNCVEKDLTQDVHLNLVTGGLTPGTYACYNETLHRQEYKTCPSDVVLVDTSSPTGAPTMGKRDTGNNEKGKADDTNAGQDIPTSASSDINNADSGNDSDNVGIILGAAGGAGLVLILVGLVVWNKQRGRSGDSTKEGAPSAEPSSIASSSNVDMPDAFA